MEKLLQDKLNQLFEPLRDSTIKKYFCISSGSTNKSWGLELKNGKKFFIKTTTSHEIQRLSFEAEGLIALNTFSNKTLLEIPKPLGISTSDGIAILLLPWLEIESGNQRALAEGLAELHKVSASKNTTEGYFGWENPGFIGAGIQTKGWRKSWGECFIELRLLPQLKLAASWGLKSSNWKNLLDKLIPFLNTHNPSPSLVHGDLWSGNCGSNKNGKGILIDPASWWADREVDLAMTKLFGGFSPTFYNSYEKFWPLPEESEKRVEIYNLYHLINHANIFGGSYKELSKSSLNQLNNLYVI